MDKYSKHFLLNVDTAKEYAVEKVGYFKEDEKLEAIEIGDGNINYVFKVWNPETGKSLIIKQADTVLRSSGRPLDMHRNKIEAEILGIEGKLSEGFVPEIYLYDENMYALSMEDISASVTNVDQRVPMERALIQIGIKLIKERRTLKNGAAIKAVGKEYLK